MGRKLTPEFVFNVIDKRKQWPFLFNKIRLESDYDDLSTQISRMPEFRGRNRYRDVSPYDHTRIILLRDHIDYINANLVCVPQADRSYILTQGPLPHTASHFWLMVWEQNSKAIIMLNNVIEKGQMKCFPYFPSVDEERDMPEMIFEDVQLKVIYKEEENKDSYVVRSLELHDLQANEVRSILQFHCKSWPDFGVPKSPAAFLDLLVAVRQSGALSTTVGPAVIHCSAGIGRSGTFCLVDSALVMAEINKSLEDINVIQLIMEMRRYRMGLIQSFDQLRFSYQAIIDGAKLILNLPSDQADVEEGFIEDSFNVDDLFSFTASAEHPQMYRQFAVSGSSHKLSEWSEDTHINSNCNINNVAVPVITAKIDEDPGKEGVEIRRRNREERVKQTQKQLEQMKQKLKETEKQQSSFWYHRRYYIFGLSVLIVVGTILYNRVFM